MASYGFNNSMVAGVSTGDGGSAGAVQQKAAKAADGVTSFQVSITGEVESADVSFCCTYVSETEFRLSSVKYQHHDTARNTAGLWWGTRATHVRLLLSIWP